MWALVFMAIAATDGSEAGSVEGPFGWAESRTSFASIEFAVGPNFNFPFPLLASGRTVLTQGRVVAGRGISFGTHRLVGGLSVIPTGLLDSAENRGLDTRLRGSILITPALALVFVHEAWTFRTRLAVPAVPGQFRFASTAWTPSIEPSIHARVARGALLIGAELSVSGALPYEAMSQLVSPLPSCAIDSTRCIERTFPMTTGGFTLLGSWQLERFEFGVRFRADARDELWPVLAPDASGALTRPRWLRTTERAELNVSASVAKHLGASLCFGIGLEQRMSGFSATTGWIALSLWVRSSSSLQRNWLDL